MKCVGVPPKKKQFLNKSWENICAKVVVKNTKGKMMAKDLKDKGISTRSFNAPFVEDAHIAADRWLGDREEISRKEFAAGDAGVVVTINYKSYCCWGEDVLQLFRSGKVKTGSLLGIYRNTEIIKNKCDKNWISLDRVSDDNQYGVGGHCYIECVYENLFKKYREKQGHLLEVGIETGTSLLLWYLYFSNMKIHGMDIDDKTYGSPKEITIEQFDTTDLSPSLKEYVENNLKKFDIIIDDGDHRWRSQFQTAVNLFPTLKDDGVYIIEDIEQPSELEEALVNGLNPHIKIHDNRDIGNSNEVIFEIKKGKTNEKVS